MTDTNINEKSIKVTGTLHIVLTDEHGNIIQESWEENLVVTVGLAHIADQLSSVHDELAMSHMAIGNDDDPAPALGNTTLNSELGRVALTSRTQGVVLTNTVVYVATFPPGTGTGNIVEAGLFNAAVAGTMLCRSIFAVKPKGALDTLNVTWTLTIA
ncbi:MAG: hypothetical protein EHM34_00085 [Nitrosopumilales archaeon]|nr:MAG: hypothetical protein EHM34_00085 [Nitrosopumilales archaeon]